MVVLQCSICLVELKFERIERAGVFLHFVGICDTRVRRHNIYLVKWLWVGYVSAFLLNRFPKEKNVLLIDALANDAL